MDNYELLAKIDRPNYLDTKKHYVHQLTLQNWKQPTQWSCLNVIISIESGWDSNAQNPTSSAYGLFQQLKLPNTATVSTQARLGLKYIKHRYGKPCKAYHHHKAKGWY